MVNQNSKKVLEEISHIVSTGNESDLRKYLAEHIKELPADLQENIIAIFVEEALENKAKEDGVLTEIVKKAAETANDAVEFVQKAQKKLEFL